MRSMFAATLLTAILGASADSGFMSPDGREPINCPLPGTLHQENTGGSDGAGLCVFASCKHAGLWQNDPLFAAIFDWMQKHPGGGYPEKVDAMLKRASKELGLPIPPYVQLLDADDDLLELASANGYMLCVTYSKSPTGRYNGGKIAHMVNAAHYSKAWVGILDNNYIGEDEIEWMTPAEFRRIANLGGEVWAIVLLTPPPPPAPK